MTQRFGPTPPPYGPPPSGSPQRSDSRRLGSAGRGPALPTQVGPYAIEGELGRGGMGVVLRGRAPDGRAVAIKLVLSAWKPEALERFERERRLLASFGEAEGFVPLLDAGTTPDGPFLVMPLLTGGTLRERLRRGKLGIDEARALGVTLGEALGRAHAKGIVHRDLKPENILHDEAGRPLVADLGLAKHFRRDVEGGEQSLSITIGGAGRGTVGYMPPEQTFGGAEKTGPPADVFALGAILHECLTGTPVFEGETVHTVIGMVVAGDVPSPRVKRPECPEPLAQVVLQAMAAKAPDRPQDGAALAAALAATAGPAPRRPPSLVVVGATGALAGFLGVGSALLLFGPRAAALASVEVAPVGSRPATVDDPALAPLVAAISTEGLTVRHVVGDPRFRLRDGVRAIVPLPGGRTALVSAGDGAAELLDLEGGRGVSLPELPRGWNLQAAAVSPDGRRGLIGGDDGRLRLYALDGEAPAQLPAGRVKRRRLHAVAFVGPDRAVSVGDEPGARLWRITDEAVTADGALEDLELPGETRHVHALVVGENGSLAATGGDDRTVVVWDLTMKRRLGAIEGFGGPVRALAPLGGTRVAAAGDDGAVRVLDLASRAVVATLDAKRPAFALATSADRRLLALGCADGTVALWELGATPRERWAARAHWSEVRAVAFAGATLVSGSKDTNVRLWDPATGQERPRPPSRGHGDWVRSLWLSPDGGTLLSAGDDETVRRWEVSPDGLAERTVLRGHVHRARAVAASADLRVVVSGGDDRAVRLWDLARGVATDALPGHTDTLRALSLTPDGLGCATGGDDGALRVWDLAARTTTRTLEKAHAGGVTAVAFTQDGGRLFSGGEDKAVRLWTRGGQPLGEKEVPTAITCVATSPDGEMAYSGGADGTASWWELATLREARRTRSHAEAVAAVAFSPDGLRAVTAGGDQTVALWDLTIRRKAAAKGWPKQVQEVARVDLSPLGDTPVAVTWSRDGRTIVVGTGRGLLLVLSPN